MTGFPASGPGVAAWKCLLHKCLDAARAMLTKPQTDHPSVNLVDDCFLCIDSIGIMAVDRIKLGLDAIWNFGGVGK